MVTIKPPRPFVGLIALFLAAGCGATGPTVKDQIPTRTAVPPVTGVATEVPPPAPEPERTVRDARTGVAFPVPAGWDYRQDADGNVLVLEEGSLRIVVTPVDVVSAERSDDQIEAEVDKLVTQIACIGLPERVSAGGRNALRVGGTGIVDGRLVSWTAQRIAFPKPVVVVAVVAHEHSDARQPDIDRFIASLSSI